MSSVLYTELREEGGGRRERQIMRPAAAFTPRSRGLLESVREMDLPSRRVVGQAASLPLPPHGN
jgi:hypothetical protein